MEPLELRRTIVRRETTIYVMGLCFLLGAVASVWVTARLWVDLLPRLGQASATGVVTMVGGGLLVTALLLLLLWHATSAWQLILRPGRPEDVVLRADRHGLLLTDAGYRVEVPWASVASLRIEPWRPDMPALVSVVTGPVDRSRDPLAWFVVRGLRKGQLKFGLGPDDPTPEQVRAGVSELSAGALEVR